MTSRWDRFEFANVKLREIETDCLHDKALFVMEEQCGEADKDRQPGGPQSHSFGQGPYTVASGDIVCVILGCRVPLILREQGEHYATVGDAYVHSFMHGEALRGLGSGIATVEEFSIY